jgi:pimeloyl-ACP methyl ester carboxylesterase
MGVAPDVTVEPTSPSLVPTRFGSVHVETAAGGPRDLVAITPIGAAWTARALPNELTELFTIHLVELPGTGRSPTNADTSTVPAIVAACEDVVRTIGQQGREVFLFGHSMNGALALAAAAGSATPMAGVIAVAPPPALRPDPSASTAYWDAKAEPARRRRGADLIAAHGRASDDEKRALQEAFDRLRRWYDLTFDPTEMDALASSDLSWVAAVFESGTSIDWPERLRSIHVPVLLALGEYDFVCPPTSWTDDLIPVGATVEVFPRSAHTPFLEQPDEFVEVVRRWLAPDGPGG